MSATASSDGLVRRALSVADIPGALALSIEAGWNQTAEDWRLMLARGCGLGVVAADGRLAASAIAHGYGGRFGWISMVLVTRAQRRRGLATELLTRCIDALRNQGLTPGLDATDAGQEVYRPLGFRDVYALTRLMADAAVREMPVAPGIRPIAMADLPALCAYDARIFGAERGDVLAHLLARAPALGWIATAGGEVRGFALGRDGREAVQIGPLSAEDEATAVALVDAAIAKAAGRMFIDAVDRHAGLHAHLARRGFRPQRPFTRMLLGRAAPIDDPSRVYAIAGPELG